MSESPFSATSDTSFKKEHFDISDLQDEIRVDQLCTDFLRLFYLDLVEDELLPKEVAGQLAHGADFFLRDFVIADRRENIFALRPARIRQFAGNWYIVKTLEPNMAELSGILRGIAAFYRYCRKVGKVQDKIAEEVARECADLDYYRQRIDSFWDIEGAGYFEWERECTLKE